MVTLIIRERLIGLNEYVNACRRNRYYANDLKQGTEAKITAYIKEQINGVHFHEPVRLSFRWYEENRKRDIDNIAMAKKFILDALVKSGVLVDDSMRWVKGFTDEFFIDKERPRVEVDIEGVGDSNGKSGTSSKSE